MHCTFSLFLVFLQIVKLWILVNKRRFVDIEFIICEGRTYDLSRVITTEKVYQKYLQSM